LLCVGLSRKVDVGGVLAAGRPLVVEGTVDVPSFGSCSFEPARVSLDVARVDRNLGLSGTIDVVATGACGRCLDDVRTELHVDVDEAFAANPSPEGELGETNVLGGTLLDIADLCRQLIDSALPIVLLCSDHCPGLCPTCGNPRRDGACACAAEA